MEAKDMSVIHWWIDASFAVHDDYKSHTGACLSFGRGCPVNISSKPKTSTCSLTEAELVAINDATALVLWCRLFIMGQGFDVHDNIVYQDNQSTMLLGNNGRHSSGKKTRHIEIRYYFITDHIKCQNICLAYCPTEKMISDFFLKLLQGSQFRKFCDFILNVDHGDQPVGTQECVGTSSATTESRIEPDVTSVCPAPSPSMPPSYAQVVAGATTSGASGSLARSQRSKVNSGKNIGQNIVWCSLMWLMPLRSLSNCDYELKNLPRLILGPIHSNQVMGTDPVGSHHGTRNSRSNSINLTYPYQSHD